MTLLAAPVKAVARKAGLRRAHVAAARMQAEREVLALTARAKAAATGRILCYHSVGTPEWGVNDVSPERFAQQIDSAVQLGYRFVPASTVASGRATANDLAITFDDAVASAATHAAPMLADRGIPWTLFVVSDWAEGKHEFPPGVLMGWSDIEKLAASGVEIGSHSVSHPDFGSLDLRVARHELEQSRRVIGARTGIEADSFAIPMGQSGNWSPAAHLIAQETGYERIYAQCVNRRPPNTVARTFITRFDDRRIFAAALRGAFDGWEEWV